MIKEVPDTKVKMSKRFAAVINAGGLIIAWIVIFFIFAHFAKNRESFLSRGTLELIARQSTIVCMAALGTTLIIVAGGIDLSIGSVVAFSAVAIAIGLMSHLNPLLALLLGVGAGALSGLWNGFLVTRLKVGPFIVTLGSLLLFRGIAKGLAHEQSIYPPATWLNSILATLGPDEQWKIAPAGVWLTIIFAILVSLLLKRTVFGRHIVAIGSNEAAARLCGVPVTRVKVLVYILGGLFAGLAGVMQYSRLTVGDPTVAVGLELDVIAAVVIGGASLSGGQGTIFGSLLGAIIMATISTGCTQINLDTWVQNVVTGLIIVAAVALDRLRTKAEPV